VQSFFQKYNRAVVVLEVIGDSVDGRNKRLWADLTLLGVAVIWGTAFMVQRLAAQSVGVHTFNGLRFLVGALVLLPFLLSEQVSKIISPHAPPLQNRHAERNAVKSKDAGSRIMTVDVRAIRPGAGAERRKTLGGILLAGLLLASGAAFQQAGLQQTTAGNAGFITGLYVVLIPLFLALIWRKKPRRIIWAASVLACMGLFLLSTGGVLRLNRGDLLELIGAVFWALHVILIGWMVQRVDVLRFATGQFLVCGLISLGVGLWIEPQGLSWLPEQWWVVAYTGVFSVGLGYTLQAAGQRIAPPADAAIILSMEAVFAALSGWIFLQERLSPAQLAGCSIILFGMLLAQSDALLGARLGKLHEG
jgi:drug/metabolite transporter (DMT)-like permease